MMSEILFRQHASFESSSLVSIKYYTVSYKFNSHYVITSLSYMYVKSKRNYEYSEDLGIVDLFRQNKVTFGQS